MKRGLIPPALLLLLSLPSLARTEEKAPPLGALTKLPVKEITVFKDGHAFVLHEGTLATDATGDVLLDSLPNPVLGTFWPYSAERDTKLATVTVSRRRVAVPRTAIDLRELVEANVGAEVFVTEAKAAYPATIAGFLTRSAEEIAATSLPNAGEALPQKSNLLMLKTPEGTKVLPFDRILDIRFLGAYKTTLANEEFRNLLTLKLDWQNQKPRENVAVGMVYLQKGVRWIPNYQVDIDGAGKAVVKLQATLLNELIDLQNVTVNLVVGVPTFAFKESVDPVGLGQVAAQLSQYFDEPSQMSNAFSNAVMTQQVSRMGERIRGQAQQPPRVAEAPPDLGPEIGEGGKTEDLYIFTVKNVSLKKGQRMVLPISRHELTYKDVYVLDVPFAPPPEIRRTQMTPQQAEMARMYHSPKVQHKLRLSNKSGQPLTTAPALLTKGNRVLAQAMMTYTPAGSSVDIALTTAVDVKVKKSDSEEKRIPNAANWQGDSYFRVDLAGTLDVMNYRAQPIELEIVRHVLGNVSQVDKDGKIEMVNVFEDDGYAGTAGFPPWWGWYSWPGWWSHFNGIGKVTWNVKLDPGKGATLGYKWNYYWR